MNLSSYPSFERSWHEESEIIVVFLQAQYVSGMVVLERKSQSNIQAYVQQIKHVSTEDRHNLHTSLCFQISRRKKSGCDVLEKNQFGRVSIKLNIDLLYKSENQMFFYIFFYQFLLSKNNTHRPFLRVSRSNDINVSFACTVNVFREFSCVLGVYGSKTTPCLLNDRL